jgi:hypothetical protein
MACRASGCTKSPSRSSLYCVSHEPELFTQAGPGASAAYNSEEPRRCSQLNKKGEPCKAWSLKSDEQGRCPAHAGSALKHLDPARAQQRSAQVRKERKEARKKGLMDLLNDRLEAKADRIAERLEKLIDDGSDADFLKAMSEWMNRTHGRPKETVAVEHEESPVERRLRQMSTDELEQLIQRGRRLRAVQQDAEEETG